MIQQPKSLMNPFRDPSNQSKLDNVHGAMILPEAGRQNLKLDTQKRNEARHVTINRNLEGFDHKLSLEEDELTILINSIRRIEKMMGSPDKALLPSELIAREKYNVSMVSRVSLKKGHVLDLDDITWKNPGTGIPSSEVQNYLGRVIAQDVPEDVLFSPDMFS